MKIFLFVTIALLGFVTNGLAQDFSITDYTYKGTGRSEKSKWLGGSVSITFYDNAVRLDKFYDGNGVEQAGMKFPILDKVDDKTYSSVDKTGKVILKLETILGYIRTATIYSYDYREGHSNEVVIVKLTRK